MGLLDELCIFTRQRGQKTIARGLGEEEVVEGEVAFFGNGFIGLPCAHMDLRLVGIGEIPNEEQPAFVVIAAVCP